MQAGPQARDEVKAVDIGHGQVDQDHLRPEAGSDAQRLSPTIRRSDDNNLAPAMLFEKPRENAEEDGIVIHEQDRYGRCHLCPSRLRC